MKNWLITFHIQIHKYTVASFSKPEASKIDTKIIEAEKIVEYPLPFVSLHWLLSNEVANVAIQLRKLAVTDDPSLKIAK